MDGTQRLPLEGGAPRSSRDILIVALRHHHIRPGKAGPPSPQGEGFASPYERTIERNVILSGAALRRSRRIRFPLIPGDFHGPLDLAMSP